MPAQIHMKIDGLDKLLAAIRRHPSVALSETKRALADAGHTLHDDLAKYPAPRGTSYRRTGTLGRTWASQPVTGPGQKIGNATPYARYVQGAPPVWFHRGRWLDVRKALEQRRTHIERLMRGALERIAGRLAGK